MEILQSGENNKSLNRDIITFPSRSVTMLVKLHKTKVKKDNSNSLMDHSS